MVLQGQDWHTVWDNSGVTWREKWDHTLDSLAKYPKNEQMEILGSAVRSGGGVTNPEQEDVFKRAQEALLSIPGHAQYFADRLAAARKKASDPWTDGRYHDEFGQILETMCHLPSPETVRVLGGMLESEEDPRSPEIDHDFFAKLGASNNGKGIGDSNLIELCNPPTFAMGAFHRLGLREQPDQSTMNYYRAVKEYRAWWGRLKSGALGFSFKGTKVEYRFKPEGTWETLAMAKPPDDAPKPPQARDRAKERPATMPDRPAPIAWWWAWIMGGTLAVLAASLWLTLRFRKPRL